MRAQVLFTLSAPTFGVCMIMLGMLDPYFDTSTLRVAAIMAGDPAPQCFECCESCFHFSQGCRVYTFARVPGSKILREDLL